TEPFASVRTAAHPGGGVTTAVPKTRIEATSTSPATTAGGRGIASLLLAEIAFPAAPRKTIPPAGVLVTVQLNVSAASTLVPSRTVIATANGLEAAAPAAIVPD